VAEHASSRGRRPNHRDEGFTLVEVLIVVVLLGLISTVIAGAVIVVLRTAPSTEVRAEDARSVQGLVTWLPQDVDAAPPSGFNRGHGYWPCAGSAPADSYNILTTEWTEQIVTVQQFAATYRYERVSDEWRIVRYTCTDGATGTMGAGSRLNLTSQLPAWDPVDPPAQVTMCAAYVDAGAACPSADVIPSVESAPAEVRSLRLTVTRIDGAEATIDAAPKNPDEDLSDDPDAAPNLSPTLATNVVTVQMYAGDTYDFDVTNSSYFTASDPDGDPISVALDSTEPLPTGITVTTEDPTIVHITADAGLPSGLLSPSVILIVSDNRAGWIDAIVNVEILPEPNVSPTASNATYHLVIEQGTTVVLPLDATHGVVDGNGDTLEVTVDGYPATLINPPKTDSPGPLDLEVKAPSGADLGTTINPILLTVDDLSGDPTLALEITVEIVGATPNQAPTATSTTITVDMYPGDDLTLDLATSHGVSDPDGDAISISGFTTVSGVTVGLDGPLELTLSADPSLLPPVVVGPVQIEVDDVYGDDIDLFVQINVLEIPPAGSDCILDSIVATPSTIGRHNSKSNVSTLDGDMDVTVSYRGTCDGLTLNYDTGHTSGLGIPGRTFPDGSPSTLRILGEHSGGSEKWRSGTFVLRAETTSDVSPNSIQTTITVN